MKKIFPKTFRFVHIIFHNYFINNFFKTLPIISRLSQLAKQVLFTMYNDGNKVQNSLHEMI